MKTTFMICALSLFAMVHSASMAHGHSWYTAQKNAAGQGCCGGQDCAEIPYEAVKCTTEGCTVTLSAGEHLMLTEERIGTGPVVFSFEGFPASSPDGKAHACFTMSDVTARRVRCLFYGGAS